MYLRRLLAFLIDVVPITALCAAYFAYFGEFGDILKQYFDQPSNPAIRELFLQERNFVRSVSAVLCAVYFVIFESTSTRNTIGKAILGIRVVRSDGEEMTFFVSVRRNLMKFLSILPAGLGLLLPLFRNDHLFLHDWVAGTKVVRSRNVNVLK